MERCNFRPETGTCVQEHSNHNIQKVIKQEAMTQLIGTLTRRLRVRDDGAGKGRDTDGTFAEFENEDAIILLGDPGMGRQPFLRVLPKRIT